MKPCIKCNVVKELSLFRKHNECVDGRCNTCKDCFKLWTKEYERTPKGLLMRRYRNMKSRVTGVQKAKYHLYKGKSLLPKKDFYDWSIDHPDFLKLYKGFVESGYEMKLSPSVDRIDSDLGYEISNMRWITHSENSRLGCISKNRKRK